MTAVTHGFADVGEVMLHYVTAGSGPPLLLLHGWPQSWYEWRKVIPALSRRYTVIAPDMRGLGDSSRPPGGYHKKTIAGDIWRLMHGELGHVRFHVAGHDWGGPVGFQLAAQHPDAVAAFAMIDVIVPGDGGDLSQGGRRWHHAFHMTPDLPEALTLGRERAYLTWFYRTFSYRPEAIGDADVDEYLRTYTQTGAMRAGFAYYRAIVQDIADNKALLESGFRLSMPTLGIGGGRTDSRGRAREPEESLRRVGSDVRGAVAEASGHLVPEEAPEFLADELLGFFGQVSL